MKLHSWRRLWAVLGVFLLFASLSAFAVVQINDAQKMRNLEHGRYLLESEANKLQYSIDSRLLKLEILEMMVIENEGMIHDFENTAKQLYDSDSSIRSIQMAPKGVVEYVYPLKGNEEAFGDLFSDPDRKEEAEYARDTGNMTMAGPFELYQGGMGVIVRRPIYLTQNNQKEFWGFAIAVMDVPEIFDKAGLQQLNKEGYLYQISRTMEDGSKQIISGSKKIAVQDAIEIEIDVPGSKWKLAICPAEGWISKKSLAVKVFVALIFDILAALLAFYFITSERQKKDLDLLAHTDPLTRLYNERYLTSKLKELICAGKPFCLLYLDLNKFKEVNDSYGHDVGDKLLTVVANRIQTSIRKEDYACRIGGDEFAVIIDADYEDDFYEVLRERLKKAIEAPFAVEEIRILPTVSCGYARYPYDERNMDKLIKIADQRMYREKMTSNRGW